MAVHRKSPHQDYTEIEDLYITQISNASYVSRDLMRLIEPSVEAFLHIMVQPSIDELHAQAS